MLGRFLFVTLMAALASADSPPPVPVGLWQNKDEGFVLRIEACGKGFCGFAAGAPKDGKKKKGNSKEVCGHQMLKEFAWSYKNNRWEGRMQPPDSSIALNASITSDGKSVLTMKAKLLLVGKTMTFAPFTGKIGDNCRLE